MSGGWGSFGWGDEPWGTDSGAVEQPRWSTISPWAGRAVPASTVMRGTVPQAWPDVTLLVIGSARTVDSSQRDTDLTARGTYAASEASSARTAITTNGHGVYHSVLTSADNTANAVLMQHGPTSLATFGFRLYLDSGDIVLEWDSGTYSATIASALNLSGSDEYVISFTVRPNPDTTGASDAVLVELQAHNITLGTYHRAPMVAGGTFNCDGADTLMVGGRWDGGAVDREVGQIPVAVRIGTAPRAFAAVCDEFVAPAAWSTFDQWDQWRPGPMLPAALAAEGEWYGPQPGVAASATQHVRRRCMGSVHNHIWPSEVPASINGDTFGDGGSILAGQLAYIPNSTRYVLPLTTIVQFFPHQLATRIRGRVYIEAQDVSGASVVVPVVSARLVCIDRLPGAQGAQWKSGDAVSSTIASLAGEWFDLPPVEIIRASGIGLLGGIGSCVVGVAIAIDPGDLLTGSEEADWQWRIRALCTWQYTGDGDGIESLPLSPGYGGGFGGSTV